MRQYINVYGGAGKLFGDVFTALKQNEQNIQSISDNYEQIGVIYASKECSTIKVMEEEGLSNFGGFFYEAHPPEIGKIVTMEVFVGEIEYAEVLEAITEEIEHLRLYSQGVPEEKHHDILTQEFIREKAKSLTSAEKELQGWKTYYFLC